MHEFLSEVDTWRAAGERVAIATVVKVEGSAPRPVGATMAVSSGGELAGSVSGGCVESAVFEEAQDVLRTGIPKLLRYGITDEMAWDVGLACGGTIPRCPWLPSMAPRVLSSITSPSSGWMPADSRAPGPSKTRRTPGERSRRSAVSRTSRGRAPARP